MTTRTDLTRDELLLVLMDLLESHVDHRTGRLDETMTTRLVMGDGRHHRSTVSSTVLSMVERMTGHRMLGGTFDDRTDG